MNNPLKFHYLTWEVEVNMHGSDVGPDSIINVPAVLAKLTGQPRSAVRRWIAEERVHLNGRRVEQDDIPDPGPSAEWSGPFVERTRTVADQFRRPTVGGEYVKILGPKPNGFTGLGHQNGDILVEYPGGEQGCVCLSDIQECGSTDPSSKVRIEPT